MRTTWNPSECYNTAKYYLSEEKLKDLRMHLLSIRWKFALCRYHQAEYISLIRFPSVGINKEIVKATVNLFEMSANSEVGKDFRLNLFYAEAHVMAFAQALHSVADILAHIIEICLELNFDNKQVNFSNVLDSLKGKKIAPEVYKVANKLSNSKEFIYLNAFVNTIKHRRLIEMPYNINLDPGKEVHGLKINSFKYGRSHKQDASFEPRWVHDFFDADFEKLSNKVGELGVTLNHYMKACLGKK